MCQFNSGCLGHYDHEQYGYWPCTPALGCASGPARTVEVIQSMIDGFFTVVCFDGLNPIGTRRVPYLGTVRDIEREFVETGMIFD